MICVWRLVVLSGEDFEDGERFYQVVVTGVSLDEYEVSIRRLDSCVEVEEYVGEVPEWVEMVLRKEVRSILRYVVLEEIGLRSNGIFICQEFLGQVVERLMKGGLLGRLLGSSV